MLARSGSSSCRSCTSCASGDLQSFAGGRAPPCMSWLCRRSRAGPEELVGRLWPSKMVVATDATDARDPREYRLDSEGKMIAVPPGAASSGSAASCRMLGAEGACCVACAPDIPPPPAPASLSSRARYVSVAAFDPQSRCCATIGDTLCTCSQDSCAICGVTISDSW